MPGIGLSRVLDIIPTGLPQFRSPAPVFPPRSIQHHARSALHLEQSKWAYLSKSDSVHSSSARASLEATVMTLSTNFSFDPIPSFASPPCFVLFSSADALVSYRTPFTCVGFEVDSGDCSPLGICSATASADEEARLPSRIYAGRFGLSSKVGYGDASSDVQVQRTAKYKPRNSIIPSDSP
ncbi:hypothetical protein CF319_g7763 [Tilletia indica]|nr:hypothetical protein CF319_g7763 [Tilletia indica]